MHHVWRRPCCITSLMLVATFLVLPSFVAAQESENDAASKQNLSTPALEYETLTTRKIDKRILYVGANAKFERTKHWLAYLKANFVHAEHARISEFEKVDTSKFDVFIFDSDQARLLPSKMGSVGILAPPTPNLSHFSKPTILIGDTGAHVSDISRLMFSSL